MGISVAAAAAVVIIIAIIIVFAGARRFVEMPVTNRSETSVLRQSGSFFINKQSYRKNRIALGLQASLQWSISYSYSLVDGLARWLGRLLLAALPVITLCTSCPLWVSQIGQLSYPALWSR